MWIRVYHFINCSNERVPDLLLTDLRMPGLNGFALIRLLRTRDRTRALPIIAISVLKDRASVTKALDLGANDYVTKPVDFELLAGKIERIYTFMLHRNDIKKRERSGPRKVILCDAKAVMPVQYPEREGVWIASPFNIAEGEALQFDGSQFLDALRLPGDNSLLWSRVEHCKQESDNFQLKLLFDPIPEDYDANLALLNRARNRFRSCFEGGKTPVHLDFPCSILELSGGGMRLKGNLPWQVGASVRLNLSKVIGEMGFTASKPLVEGTIQWSKAEGNQHLAGVRFTGIEDSLQEQIMESCLPPVKSVRSA